MTNYKIFDYGIRQNNCTLHLWITLFKFVCFVGTLTQKFKKNQNEGLKVVFHGDHSMRNSYYAAVKW